MAKSANKKTESKKVTFKIRDKEIEITPLSVNDIISIEDEFDQVVSEIVTQGKNDLKLLRYSLYLKFREIFQEITVDEVGKAMPLNEKCTNHYTKTKEILYTGQDKTVNPFGG